MAPDNTAFSNVARPSCGHTMELDEVSFAHPTNVGATFLDGDLESSLVTRVHGRTKLLGQLVGH
jgi:hypothetical protein